MMPRNTSGGDRHVAVQTAANHYLITWMHDELPQVILGGQAAKTVTATRITTHRDCEGNSITK